MSFKIGKVSVGEAVALIGMLLIPEIYLTEPSLMIGFTGTSAWICKILSGVLVAGVLLAVLKMYRVYIEKFSGGQMIPFPDFLKGLLGSRGALLLLVVWALLFEIETILTLREFVDHTVITALKANSLRVVLLIFAGSMLLIACSGLEVILRVAYVFFAIGIVSVVLVFLLLIPSYDPLQLFPWQGYGFANNIKYSLFDIGMGAQAIALLFIAPHFQNIRTLKKGIFYGIGYTLFTKVLVFLMALMVFGVAASPERGLIYYELARYVNISQYLQRIDAVFIIVWLSAGLISSVLTQYFSVILFQSAFRLKDTKVLLSIGILLTAAMAMLPNSIAQTIQWRGILSYYVTMALFLATFLVLGIGYYMKCRRNASCVGQLKS